MKTALLAGLLVALAFAGPAGATATAAVAHAPAESQFICPFPVFPVTIVCNIVHDFCDETDLCESALR